MPIEDLPVKGMTNDALKLLAAEHAQGHPGAETKPDPVDRPRVIRFDRSHQGFPAIGGDEERHQTFATDEVLVELADDIGVDPDLRKVETREAKGRGRKLCILVIGNPTPFGQQLSKRQAPLFGFRSCSRGQIGIEDPSVDQGL